MNHTLNKTRIVSLACALVAIPMFGFGYFQVVRKNWSWPVAALLALVWGTLAVLVILRVCRCSDNAENQKDL